MNRIFFDSKNTGGRQNRHHVALEIRL